MLRLLCWGRNNPVGYYTRRHHHDYAKYDEIEDQINSLELDIIKAYVDTPVIYHAFAAAKALEKDYNIHDQDVLNAIRYHVWGRIGMSDIEKVVLISDSCEPNRKFEDDCPAGTIYYPGTAARTGKT